MTTEEQAAAIRIHVPRGQMPQASARRWTKLMGVLEDGARHLRLRAGHPVADPVSPTARVEQGTLPAAWRTELNRPLIH